MTTFSDGESGSSVRTKINASITKTDYLTVTGAVDLDANNTKLAGIEANATADQSAAEIAAMTQDWRGAGSETLITATTALASGGVSDGDKGDITVSSSGTVWTIDNGVVSLAKMANMATASFIGRNTAGAGVPEVLSATTARAILNVEDGADVTDTTNVTAAGALMDSEVTNLAAVKAFDPTDYATAAQGALADSATQPGDDADTLGSGAATDGWVLTADGLGGAAWEAVAGGGSMSSFSLAGDSGTPETVSDSNTVTIAGGTGVATVVAATDTVTVSVTGVLEDLNTLGAPTADGEFLVATGAGAFAYESGAAARTSLGLGSIATQASSSVTITGGSISGITDLAVADGGTGASDAATARTNLGAAALGANTFTGTQDFNGQQVEGTVNKVVSSVTGSLTAADHSGNVLVTSGNVTVPTSAGFNCVLIAGGAHTVTFNATTSAAMAAGDVMTILVESSTVIHAVLTAAADKVTFT